MLSVPHIHIEICLNQSMWDDVSTLILFILMHNCYSNLVWKWFEFNCCIYAIKWNDIKRQYGSFEHLKWFLFFFFFFWFNINYIWGGYICGSGCIWSHSLNHSLTLAIMLSTIESQDNSNENVRNWQRDFFMFRYFVSNSFRIRCWTVGHSADENVQLQKSQTTDSDSSHNVITKLFECLANDDVIHYCLRISSHFFSSSMCW